MVVSTMFSIDMMYVVCYSRSVEGLMTPTIHRLRDVD